MSEFSQQLRKIPRDRQTLWNFYIFFSGVWVAGITAYVVGYVKMISGMGGHMSIAQMMIVGLVIVAPLFVIWFPYWLTREMRFSPLSNEVSTNALLDAEQLQEITSRLESLSTENKEVRSALGELLTGVSAVIHSGDNPRQVPQIQLDAPNLPLTENSSDSVQLLMSDMAVALDFTDQHQKGDWAIAFNRVQSKGSYLDLMRFAEKTIDVFEEEGVFVEDIAIDLPPEHSWRAMAKNIRDSETEKLASIKDLSAKTLIKSRLKADENFQALSLRFQKRFIDMLEAMVPLSSTAELEALAKSRAGRAFAILGGISQTFAAKDRL